MVATRRVEAKLVPATILDFSSGTLFTGQDGELSTLSDSHSRTVCIPEIGQILPSPVSNVRLDMAAVFKRLYLKYPSTMVSSTSESGIWSMSTGKGPRDPLHALARLCWRRQGVNPPQKLNEIHKSTPQAP
jgi:hypothetical protein